MKRIIKELASEIRQAGGKFQHIKKTGSAAYSILTASLKTIAPLLREKNSWLTVGDNDGFEAIFLARNNQTAHASDISDTLLQETEERRTAFRTQQTKRRTHSIPRFLLRLRALQRIRSSFSATRIGSLRNAAGQ